MFYSSLYSTRPLIFATGACFPRWPTRCRSHWCCDRTPRTILSLCSSLMSPHESSITLGSHLYCKSHRTFTYASSNYPTHRRKLSCIFEELSAFHINSTNYNNNQYSLSIQNKSSPLVVFTLMDYSYYNVA